MPISVAKKTSHPYIEINTKIASGEPIIKGTRTKVLDIAMRYEYMGMSPDDILQQFSHLNLQQFHDALSFYYEHKSEFDKKYKKNEKFLAQLKKTYAQKVKAKIKGELSF